MQKLIHPLKQTAHSRLSPTTSQSRETIKRPEKNDDVAYGVIEKPFRPRWTAAVLHAFRLTDPRHGIGAQEHEWRRDEAMTEFQVQTAEPNFEADGSVENVSKWKRATAEIAAAKENIHGLTDEHWRVIEFVKYYYDAYATGPPAVKIFRATGLSASGIARRFPCGAVKSAYRLAGLPPLAGRP